MRISIYVILILITMLFISTIIPEELSFYVIVTLLLNASIGVGNILNAGVKKLFDYNSKIIQYSITVLTFGILIRVFMPDSIKLLS